MNLNLNSMFAKSMNLNLKPGFAKSMNLNVLIQQSMNLIFSNQNFHFESSNLLTGQKDSESDQNTLVSLLRTCDAQMHICDWETATC